MKMWHKADDGRVIDMIQIDPNDMRGIMNRTRKEGFFAYPSCWAVVDGELVVWPKPEKGFTALISWP